MDELLKDLFKSHVFELYQINDLAYYLKEYYELNDYIKKIEFKSIPGDGLYMVNDKTLTIDVDNILSSSFNQYSKYVEFYNLHFDRYYLINIILTLLHEINHARQVKMSDENIDDTLHKIVREGVELGRRSPNNLTPVERILNNSFHDKILTERNANINAYYDFYLFNELKLLGQGELIYIVDRLNQYLSSGYYLYKNPCKVYYSLRDKREEYNNLDFNDKNYALYTKLSWGFPVDRSIIKEKEKLRLLIKEE